MFHHLNMLSMDQQLAAMASLLLLAGTPWTLLGVTQLTQLRQFHWRSMPSVLHLLVHSFVIPRVNYVECRIGTSSAGDTASGLLPYPTPRNSTLVLFR